MRLYQKTYKDAKGKKKTAPTWTADFFDHMGIRHSLALFRDKAASAAAARSIEKLVSFRAANERPDASLAAFLEACPKRTIDLLTKWDLVPESRAANLAPLADHIQAFRASLENKGRTADYVLTTFREVAAACTGCHFKTLSDITAPGAAGRLEVYLAGLRDKGKSARTRNSALKKAKQFTTWLRDAGKTTETPFRLLKPENEDADRRLVRRAMTPDEIAWLLAGLEDAGVHHRTTPRERSLLYRLALTCGPRWREGRLLKRADFHLDGETPSVTLGAATAKGRRKTTAPLPDGLADDFRAFFRDNPALPSAPVFRLWQSKGAEMIRRDLEAARARWLATVPGADGGSDFLKFEDATGARVDFHSARHTLATRLAASGCHPRVAQAILRHKSVETTMQTYSHVLLDDHKKAIEAAFPDTVAIDPENQAGKTGNASGNAG